MIWCYDYTSMPTIGMFVLAWLGRALFVVIRYVQGNWVVCDDMPGPIDPTDVVTWTPIEVPSWS